MSVSPGADQVRWVSELRPKLLQRAFELRGNQADADELVQDTLLRWWEEPPRARSRTQFLHWLRSVMYSAVVKRWRAPALSADLELPTGRRAGWDDGASWRPDGEANPATTRMPTSARRRRAGAKSR